MSRHRFAAVIVIGVLFVGCTPQMRPVLPLTPILQRDQIATVLPTPMPSPTLGPAPTATQPAVTPERTLTSTATPASTPTPEIVPVAFTIVYDNYAVDPTLRTAWGFACWVEAPGGTVLFDTGGDSPTLLGNIMQLGLNPRAIDAVVLSHAHGDHTGGLAGLLDLGARPKVYVPASLPCSFKQDVRGRTDLVEVTGPMEILPGVHTTGQVGVGIVEQALVVETGAGLVVVTGCAHPGIAEMVRQAKETVAGEVALVMGGFHLREASQAQIEAIIADFVDLGVQRVAPCHCTGDRARQMFADAFGANCTLPGAGQVLVVGGK